MFRRKTLNLINDNRTSRKKLDLLIKGKIAEQTELGATLIQIGRNLNVLKSCYRTLYDLPQRYPLRAS